MQLIMGLSPFQEALFDRVRGSILWCVLLMCMRAAAPACACQAPPPPTYKDVPVPVMIERPVPVPTPVDKPVSALKQHRRSQRSC